MSESARLTSLDALVDLKAAFCVFTSEAKEALSSLAMEIQHTLGWLEDQMKYWTAAVRKCEDAVFQAKTELAQLAKMPRTSSKPSKIIIPPGSIDPFGSTGRGMGGMPGGLMMMRAYIGYMQGRQKGLLEQAQLRHQEYADYALKLENDVSSRLINYGQAWSFYGDENDPNSITRMVEAEIARRKKEGGSH